MGGEAPTPTAEAQQQLQEQQQQLEQRGLTAFTPLALGSDPTEEERKAFWKFMPGLTDVSSLAWEPLFAAARGATDAASAAAAAEACAWLLTLERFNTR